MFWQMVEDTRRKKGNIFWAFLFLSIKPMDIQEQSDRVECTSYIRHGQSLLSVRRSANARYACASSTMTTTTATKVLTRATPALALGGQDRCIGGCGKCIRIWTCIVGRSLAATCRRGVQRSRAHRIVNIIIAVAAHRYAQDERFGWALKIDLRRTERTRTGTERAFIIIEGSS